MDERQKASMYRAALKVALSHEAKAYGFAVVVWSTGSITISQRGMPAGSGVLAFAGGVLAAMALMIVATFGAREVWQSRSPHRLGFGAIHVISVAAAIAAGWLAAWLIHERDAAFAVSGFLATGTFQLMLGAEIRFSLADPSEIRER
jgi:hypothetical protein